MRSCTFTSPIGITSYYVLMSHIAFHQLTGAGQLKSLSRLLGICLYRLLDRHVILSFESTAARCVDSGEGSGDLCGEFVVVCVYMSQRASAPLAKGRYSEHWSRASSRRIWAWNMTSGRRTMRSGGSCSHSSNVRGIVKSLAKAGSSSAQRWQLCQVAERLIMTSPGRRPKRRWCAS